MTTQKSSKIRLPALDGLRFIAILGVLLYYYFPQYVPGGFIGVDLFLVLAGFFAMGSLTKIPPKKPAAGLWNYGRRRLIRIGLPMLWMIVWVVAFCSLFAPELMLNMRSQVAASLTFTSNLWQIFQGGSYFADFLTPQPFTHLWYLGLQVQWLVLLPIFYFLSERAKIGRKPQILLLFLFASLSALLMALLFVPGEDPTRVYYGTDTRAFPFLIGAALYLVMHADKESQKSKSFKGPVRDGLALVAFLLLLYLAFSLGDSDPLIYRGGLMLASLAAAVLLFAIHDPKLRTAKLLSQPIVVFFGRISYGLYLWYYPVYTLSNLQPFLRQQIYLQILLIFILAVLSTRLVEIGFSSYFLATSREEGMKRVSRSFSKSRSLVSLAIAMTLLAVGFTAGYGLVKAPSGENPTQAEMEAIIEENRALIAEGSVGSQVSVETSRFLLNYARKLEVDFIGDSVLLAAANPLSASFPQGDIDAEVGRQFSEGLVILEQKVEKGELADYVVLVLGSNGAFQEGDMQALMELLKDRKVFIVNSFVPRAWQDEVNQSLAAATRRHPNCYLVDWHAVAKTHPEWLYSDHIHTNEEGALGFSDLIIRSLYDGRAQDSECLPEFIAQAADLS